MSEWLKIESLDIDAQGIAHRDDGKVVFVEGALPFETVTANVHRKKNNWEQGTVTAIARESSQRVNPVCPHFGLHAGACGGCKMQHLHPAAQVAVKQRALEDNLWHLGKVKAQSILRPIEGPTWGYRYRARLSVRHVQKKGTVLVGFHERKSRYVADMKACHVLPPHVSAMLMPLRELIFSMDARETCPQIELACGDEITALVLRHLEPLSHSDRQRLQNFAIRHPTVQWWLQAKGPDSIELLDEAKGPEAMLSYKLPEFGMTMPFKPTDFTQVNPYINRVLVSRALRLLETRKTERVIDWFCGLGNFTLPLATQAKAVLGVEGSSVLLARSKQNYEENKRLAHTGIELCAIDFIARDLFQVTPELLLGDGSAEKWLLDPPREGAFALVKALVDLIGQYVKSTTVDSANPGAQPVASGWRPPKRIVYVSCNPATLARDAGLLVNLGNYNCSFAGVVNMFPHTAHVESIAVFDWMGP